MARPSNDDEPIVESSSADSAPNPVWFKPVMIGLMLLGLVWVLIFYISGREMITQDMMTHSARDRAGSLHNSTPPMGR